MIKKNTAVIETLGISFEKSIKQFEEKNYLVEGFIYRLGESTMASAAARITEQMNKDIEKKIKSEKRKKNGIEIDETVDLSVSEKAVLNHLKGHKTEWKF